MVRGIIEKFKDLADRIIDGKLILESVREMSDWVIDGRVIQEFLLTLINYGFIPETVRMVADKFRGMADMVMDGHSHRVRDIADKVLA